jgi:hypothetical protein
VSHIVTIQTRVRDAAAVAAACERLNLPTPVQGTARIYETEATGLLVQLPDWAYPAVIDSATGTLHFDNYGGAWGDPQHLDRFLQAYALEQVKLQARRQGFPVQEQNLQDGSIKVQIIEGA